MTNGAYALNYLDIARDYLQELLHRRDDIVGAYVAGSVARGEATDLSDIDLVVIIAGEVDAALGRGGIDGWRNGIYMDAVLLAQQHFADLEALLQDPMKSTQVCEAVILYDATGFLAQQQAALRARFMEPQWLQARLTHWQTMMVRALATLRDGVTASDSLRICSGMGWFTFACASIPLVQARITPSSTQVIKQLESVAPAIRTRLLELMSVTPVSAAEVIALEPFLLEVGLLLGAAWGQFPGFYVQKMMAMAKQGYQAATLQALWLMMAVIADICLQSDDATLKAKGTDLLQNWLQKVGCETPERQAVSVQLAESLLSDVAHLSSDF